MELIGTRIDMDVPGDVGRYLGCDHLKQRQVLLSEDDHPFAYLFDKSLPDPAAKSAAAASRTQDFWEVDPQNGVFIRHHSQQRKALFAPDKETVEQCNLAGDRFTEMLQSELGGVACEQWDKFKDEDGHDLQGQRVNSLWTGTTYLFSKDCQDPVKALASVKRNKRGAKQKARAEGFSYMDGLYENQPCMERSVNVVLYDMKPFLQSCVDRYLQLAGKDAPPH